MWRENLWNNEEGQCDTLPMTGGGAGRGPNGFITVSGSTTVGVNTFRTTVLLTLTTNCDGGVLVTTQHTHFVAAWVENGKKKRCPARA